MTRSARYCMFLPRARWLVATVANAAECWAGGCRLLEAVDRQVPDKTGGLTPYNWSDLWYNLSLGRLLVDPEGGAEVDTACAGMLSDWIGWCVGRGARADRGGESSALSFDVSALPGYSDPVPFWGSILTEEERSRRKDEATDNFVQACVY